MYIWKVTTIISAEQEQYVARSYGGLSKFEVYFYLTTPPRSLKHKSLHLGSWLICGIKAELPGASWAFTVIIHHPDFSLWWERWVNYNSATLILWQSGRTFTQATMQISESVRSTFKLNINSSTPHNKCISRQLHDFYWFCWLLQFIYNSVTNLTTPSRFRWNYRHVLPPSISTAVILFFLYYISLDTYITTYWCLFIHDLRKIPNCCFCDGVVNAA